MKNTNNTLGQTCKNHDPTINTILYNKDTKKTITLQNHDSIIKMQQKQNKNMQSHGNTNHK